MPSPRIQKDLKDWTYFLTFTVNKWIDIFTSQQYFEILIENLKFYKNKYKVKLFGYVIMLNHMHLIAECSDMIRFTNSYKSFTAKKVIDFLKEDNRKYILPLLKNKKNNQYKVWKSNNWPKLVETEDFFRQKLDYIHENPVIKGYVEKEEDWVYSSARNYYNNDHSIIKVDLI